ncbi:MAG: cytochrome c, partial [Bacteroidota bacterium]
AANKDLTWPYAVTDIRLSKAGEEFLAAMPPDEAHLEGFELFKHTCIKCHTVNKVGGSMGPELNFPRNITEYWQKEDIWAFVQSPQSFRYNSKMPPMANLEREEFELIYGYLSSMVGQHFQP